MISAITNPAAASMAQAASAAAAPPTTAPSANASANAQLAPDKVSISTAGQRAASGDVDHDGDSH